MLTLDEILEDFEIYCGDKFKDRNVHIRALSGESPLHWMVTLGDHAAIKILMENGSDVSAMDSKGDTPLHYAIRYRHENAVECLLKYGASPNQANKNGVSAKDEAVEGGCYSIINLLKN